LTTPNGKKGPLYLYFLYLLEVLEDKRVVAGAAAGGWAEGMVQGEIIFRCSGRFWETIGGWPLPPLLRKRCVCRHLLFLPFFFPLTPVLSGL